jgi:hypothetical protein
VQHATNLKQSTEATLGTSESELLLVALEPNKAASITILVFCIFVASVSRERGHSSMTGRLIVAPPSTPRLCFVCHRQFDAFCGQQP